MGYFNYIPNVAVPSFLSEKKASNEYIVAKNIFRKIKILDELEDNILLFDKYEIYQGDRPDTVAKDLYGNSELDFVVILSANITNIRNQWPLSEYDLYNYSHDKYGSEINALHHYQTVEVRDSKNRLILEDGLVVNEDFEMDGPGKQYPVGTAWKAIRPSGTAINLNQERLGGNPSDLINTIGVAISNWQYEVMENNKKRRISVLKRTYLNKFLEDFTRIMRYDRNSQYISKTLITTENNNLVS